MKTATFSIRLNASLKSLWILMFFATVALVLFSIIQINTYTKELYSIKNFELKIQQLAQENRVLEASFAKANSLKNIGSYAQNQVFQKAGNVEYIKVLDATVLAR